LRVKSKEMPIQKASIWNDNVPNRHFLNHTYLLFLNWLKNDGLLPADQNGCFLDILPLPMKNPGQHRNIADILVVYTIPRLEYTKPI